MMRDGDRIDHFETVKTNFPKLEQQLAALQQEFPL